MIVDTSAIVAILRGETEAGDFVSAMIDAGGATLSAANYLESGIVIDSERDPVVSARLDALILELDIEIAAVTTQQTRIARQAYRDFGKGSGHPAKLNFGDCFAYALAMECGDDLLFKGEDFVHAGFTRVG